MKELEEINKALRELNEKLKGSAALAEEASQKLEVILENTYGNN